MLCRTSSDDERRYEDTFAKYKEVFYHLATRTHREQFGSNILDCFAEALEGHTHVGGQAMKSLDHHCNDGQISMQNTTLHSNLEYSEELPLPFRFCWSVGELT
jgi:hypothetical protein